MNSPKHHSPLEETAAVPPPFALDRTDAYDVLERLAVGPAAIVYRARQMSTQREVIFKLLLPDEVSNPLNVGMVMELKPKLAGLKHPNITEWLDAYLDPEGAVLIYDFMQGIGGQQIPQKRPLDKLDALAVARQLSQALQAGELAGFPHGDLKPSNVVIADREREGVFLQVQDWGLADCRADASQESLLFMSPERLAGGPASISSDLFSLGATLCFLLTGCVPAQGMSRDEILQSWSVFNFESIKDARPDLDDHFCKWIGWLLRLNSADRPASMSQALEVLWQVIAFANAPKPKVSQSDKVATSSPMQNPSASQRLVGPRPQGPVVPRSTPASSHSGATSKTQSSPNQNQSQAGLWLRRLAAAFAFCLMVLGVVCFSLWLNWGLGWTDELDRRWVEWKQLNYPNKISVSEAPLAAEPATLVPAGSSPSQTIADWPATERFDYKEGTELNGAAGGAGWAAPWRASGVNLVRASEVRSVFADFSGKATGSSVLRDAGSSEQAIARGLWMVVSLTHPGSEAPPMLLDLMDNGDGNALSPVLVKGEGDKLSIQVTGSKEVITFDAGQAMTLATYWTFKKQKGGKYQMEERVFLNPNKKSKTPWSRCPSSRRVIGDFTLPQKLNATLRTQGSAKLSIKVSYLAVGVTLQELLK